MIATWSFIFIISIRLGAKCDFKQIISFYYKLEVVKINKYNNNKEKQSKNA